MLSTSASMAYITQMKYFPPPSCITDTPAFRPGFDPGLAWFLMQGFSNGPSLMQSNTKVPCTCITFYRCITYGTVPCVTLQKIFSSCTVSTYTRYNCELEISTGIYYSSTAHTNWTGIFYQTCKI